MSISRRFAVGIYGIGSADAIRAAKKKPPPVQRPIAALEGAWCLCVKWFLWKSQPDNIRSARALPWIIDVELVSIVRVRHGVCCVGLPVPMQRLCSFTFQELLFEVEMPVLKDECKVAKDAAAGMDFAFEAGVRCGECSKDAEKCTSVCGGGGVGHTVSPPPAAGFFFVCPPFNIVLGDAISRENALKKETALATLSPGRLV